MSNLYDDYEHESNIFAKSIDTHTQQNDGPFRRIDLEKSETGIHKIKPKLADHIQGIPDSARVIYSEEPNPNDG